jgi:hypothetical protein
MNTCFVEGTDSYIQNVFSPYGHLYALLMQTSFKLPP